MDSLENVAEAFPSHSWGHPGETALLRLVAKSPWHPKVNREPQPGTMPSSVPGDFLVWLFKRLSFHHCGFVGMLFSPKLFLVMCSPDFRKYLVNEEGTGREHEGHGWLGVCPARAEAPLTTQPFLASLASGAG